MESSTSQTRSYSDTEQAPHSKNKKLKNIKGSRIFKTPLCVQLQRVNIKEKKISYGL